MDTLLPVLALAGLLIGATGTWSPCGLSMIETIGPTGHTGGLRTTLAAAATFAPFAVLGGVLTFGSLALLGDFLHGSGAVAYLVAAALALAAAAAEARGLPIVPQVRRQLPVGWRSAVPMPLAAAGYGTLLGLGFTTFILSYGVWALIGISVAVGEPLAGLVIGVAFGFGRALPIVALAPIADRPLGERACEAMVMRTGFYRGARVGDALALALAAVILAGSASAEGAKRVERKAADPSVSGKDLAFQRQNGAGVLRGGGQDRSLPGRDPAIGGSYAAVVEGQRIAILDRETLEEIGRIGARGADALALSSEFLAWRSHTGGKDRIQVVSIANPEQPGRPRVLAKARKPAQVGRPSLAGGLLVYAKANARKNMLIKARLRARKGGSGNRSPGVKARKRRIRASRTEGLSNPSVRKGRLAYVQTTAKKQRVRLAGLGGGKGRTLYKRRTGRGFIWSLALDRERVFITLIKGGGSVQLLRAGR